jgi:hypothetical protein
VSAEETATTARLHFRFKSIKGNAPVGFIRLDSAIDTVGAKLFPGWGTLPYFGELPFTLLHKDGEFRRWRLKRKGGKYLRRRSRVQVATNHRDAYHTLDQMYSATCDTLREALERGAIRALVASNKGNYIPVRRERWALSSRLLFFAGALGGPRKRAPFLDRSMFEAWLNTLSEPIARSRRKKMSDAQLRSVFESAAQTCRTRGYRLTKRHAFAAILEAAQLAQFEVSERRLAKAWKALPPSLKAPGRLPTEQARLQDDDRGELVGQLKAILSGPNLSQ